MDVLDEMLSSLRLSGGVFLDGQFSCPWSVTSHITPEDCAMFFAEPHHVIAYHFVRSGRLTCQVGDGPHVEVKAGEIVLMPRNEPHTLHGIVPTRPVDGRTLMCKEADGLFHIRWGGDGEKTEMYCGYLAASDIDHVLLKSLPSMMTISAVDADDDGWFVRSIDFAARDIGGSAPEMVGKLAEGLFAEAVRRWIAAMPPGGSGWLAGLKDPAVGRALALIHGHYGEPLTIEQLAREAGVSKTVLSERFRALIGEPPMQYCARWRMQMAANMLKDQRHNAASVAYCVGFNSEAAFNRAFKREFGTPPATWRRDQQPSAQIQAGG